MSLKGLLQPHFAAWLTSERRLIRHRERAERRRKRAQRPHQVRWFHQADDPYSYLLAQALPAFLKRYPVTLSAHTVSPPPLEAQPRPDLWQRHALRDCRLLASCFGLDAPASLPDAEAIAQANALLLAQESSPNYLDTACTVGRALWHAETLPEGTCAPNLSRLQANREDLHKAGHYAGGMLCYEGEWYWGLDRLTLLEQRLCALGVGDGSALSPLAPPPLDLGAQPLEFYLSARSPYSYLAIARLLPLLPEWPVSVQCKPILPMVTRGLAVPRAKRMYIVFDSKREAIRHNLPFGRICDPLGKGVSRVLAVAHQLPDQDHKMRFLHSALQGIWAEGVEVAADRGLRLVCERADVPWSQAREALRDPSWEQQVEQHRLDLEAVGLWGVPSFRIGELALWGQDRIWLLDSILRPTST